MSRAAKARPASQGFTLIETLVTLAIVSLGFALAISAMTRSLEAAGRAAFEARALSLAEMKLGENLAGAAADAPFEERGEVLGLTWIRTRRSADLTSLEGTPAGLGEGLVIVTVTVSEAGRASTVTLTGLTRGGAP